MDDDDEAAALLSIDGQIAKANAEQGLLCETKRAACASCLTRLRDAKVIR